MPIRESSLVQLEHARALRTQGRVDDAARAFEEALAAAPELAEAWFDLGELKLRAGENEAGEAAMRKVLALSPGHLGARLWLGVAIKNAGRGAEAEPILLEGLQQAGEPAQKAAFAYNLGWALYLQDKKQQALESFALVGRSPGLNTDLVSADLLEELERSDEALTLLETVLRREPQNIEAHSAYGQLLFRLDRDADALKSFDRAPQDGRLAMAKAVFLSKTDRPEAAHEVYADLLTRQPANADAALGAASALNDLGRHGEAMAPLEKALLRQPANPVLYQLLASTALQAGDAKKAAVMAERSLQLRPGDQAVLAVLGSAWRVMGDARDETLNGYDTLIRAFDLEPPEGFSSMADFNYELNGWLDGLHPKTRDAAQQSLRHGSQTRGYIFGQGYGLVEKLKQRVSQAIQSYIAEIGPDPRHPFRSRMAHGFRYKESWSSRLGDSGFHVNHIHSGGWISSCYYVDLPDAVKDAAGQQGWIKFGEPSFEIGLKPRRAIQPVSGRLVLFPSYMWHGTIPFRDTTPRTTIAFDAVPLNSR